MTSSEKIARQHDATTLSVRDVAGKLKLAPDYVSKLCREGKLKGRQVDGQWIIDSASVDRFEEQRTYAKQVRAEALAEERRIESQVYKAEHAKWFEKAYGNIKAFFKYVSAVKSSEQAGAVVYISARQAAERLQCAQDYISKLCREGKLAGTQIDGLWQINSVSIVEFVQERERAKRERAEQLAQQRRFEMLRQKNFLTRNIQMSYWRVRHFLGAVPAGAVVGLLMMGSVLVFVSTLHPTRTPSLAAISQAESPFFGLGGPHVSFEHSSNGNGIGKFLSGLFGRFSKTVAEAPSSTQSAQEFSIGTDALQESSAFASTTFSGVPAKATIVQKITYPIIERTVVREVATAGVDEDYVTLLLQNLYNRLSVQISDLQNPGRESPHQNFAVSQVINNLSNTRLNGSTRADDINATYVQTGRFYVTGQADFGGVLNAATTTTGALTVNGNATTTGVAYFGTDVNIGGNTVIAGNLTVQNNNGSPGTAFAGTTTVTNLQVQNLSTSTFAGALEVTGNTLLSNATSTNFFTSVASSTNLSTQNLQAAIVSLVNATSTNFFASTASSTSLFAQVGTIGGLSVQNATTTGTAYVGSSLGVGTTSPSGAFGVQGNALVSGTFTAGSIVATSSFTLGGNATINGGFAAYASSTIGNGNQNAGLTIFGGATTTGNALFSGGLGVGIATSAAGVLQTSGNAYIGGNLTVVGNSVTLGASSANTLSVVSSITSNLTPNQNITYDLGSPSFYWRNVYVGNINANNISAASTTISGTNSATFTVNADNATADTEDADLIFFRGSVVPNALLSWKSTPKRFEFNQSLFIQNASTNQLSNVTLDLKGQAGQTGALFNVASSSADSYFHITSAGRVGIGTTTPATSLDIYATDALHIPTGTTAQRPSMNFAGQVRYNTTTHQFEGYGDNNVWQGLGGVIDADQDTYITADTNNVNENYLRFFTAGSQRLTIANNGNIGIATSSPSSTLAVSGNSYFAGNVGVGTNNPQEAVHIKATSGTVRGLLENTSASGYAEYQEKTDSVDFRMGASGSAGSPFGVAAGGAGYIGTVSNNPVIFAANSVAQMLLSTSGLGIGTISGTHKLEVVDTTSDVAVFKNSTASQWTNVLINTDSASANLTLNSNSATRVGSFAGVTLAGSSFFQTHGGAQVFYTDTDNQPFNWVQSVSGVAATKMILNGNGNLGIATTSPTYKLSVEGSSSLGNQAIAGYFTATSSTVSSFAGGVTSYASTTIGAGTQTTGLTIFGGATTTGNAYIAGNVGIGTAVPTDKLQVSGGDIGITGSGANLYFRGPQAANVGHAGFFDLNLITNGLARVTVKDAGNVGIGATAPQSKLSVVGSSGPSNNSGIAEFSTGTGAATDEKLVFGTVDGSYSWIQPLKPGTAYRNLSLNPSGGNVGIGTTSPQAPLAVQGNVFIGNTTGSGLVESNQLIVGNLSQNSDVVIQSGSTNFGRVVFSRGISGNDRIRGEIFYDHSSDYMGFYTNAAENLRLSSTGGLSLGSTYVSTNPGAGSFILSGNLGVGITSPQAALHVLGDARFGTNTAYGDIIFATSTPLSGYNGTVVIRSNSTPGSGTATQALYLRNNIGGGTTRMDLLVDGNVGIGSTTPSNPLAVNQSGNVTVGNNTTYGLAVQNQGTTNFTIGSDVSYAYLQSWASKPLQINNQGNNTLFNVGGGNVGIGTTTPARALDVYTNGAPGLRLESAASNQGIEMMTGPTKYSWLLGAQYNVDGGFEITPSTAVGGATFSTPAWYITNTGNVTQTGTLTVQGTGNSSVAGNFGIGTTTPATTLSVQGNALVSGTSTIGTIFATSSVGIGAMNSGAMALEISHATGLLAQFTRSGTGVMQLTYTGGFGANASTYTTDNGTLAFSPTTAVSRQGYMFRTRDSGNTLISALYVNNGGYVGIGTTTPLALLNVNGNSSSYTPTIFNVSSTTAASVTSSLFNVLATGNVGIGTSSPYSTLSVAGQVVAQNFVATSTTATSTFFGPTFIGGGSVSLSPLFSVGTSSTPIFVIDNQRGTIGINQGAPVSTGAKLSLTTDLPQGINVSSNQNADITAFRGDNTNTAGSAAAVKLQLNNNNANAYMYLYGSGVATSSYISPNGMLLRTDGQNMNFAATRADAYMSWFTGGSSERMRLDASGNLGIGTSSPWARMSVDSSTLGSSPAFVVGSSTATSLLVTNGGIVSVGSASPNTGAKLYVNGTGTNGLVIDTTAGGNALNFLTSGTYRWTMFADTGALYFYDQPNAATRLTLQSATGNVGIGTTSPTYKLSVEGSSSLGNQAIAGYITATSSTASSFAANVGIGTTNPGSQLAVVSASAANTGISIVNTNASGISNLTFDYSGTGSGGPSSTNLGRIWAPTNANDLYIGTGQSGGGAADIIFKSSTASAAGYNNEIMRLQRAGNVGVGTSTPWGQLSASSTGTYPAFVAQQRSTGAAGIFLGGNVGIGTTSPQANLGIQGSIGVNSTHLLLNTNGTVGLGVAGGNAKLTINGAGANTSYGQIAISNSAVSAGTAVMGIETGPASIAGTGVLGDFSIVSPASLNLGTLNGGTIKTVNNTTAQMQFSGWSQLSTDTRDGALFIGNSASFRGVIQYGVGASTPILSIDNTYDDVNAAIQFRTRTSGTSTTTAMTITGNGRIGIGTTTPNTLLSIQGATPTFTIANSGSGQTGTIQFLDQNGTNNGGISVNASTGEIRYNAATGSFFPTFYANGSEAARISATGNLGIGTSSPFAKLSLKGAGTGTGVTFQTTNSSDQPIFSITDNGIISNIYRGTAGAATSSITGATNFGLNNTTASYLNAIPNYVASINAQTTSSDTLVLSNAGVSSPGAGINFQAGAVGVDSRLWTAGHIVSGYASVGSPAAYNNNFITLGTASAAATFRDELTIRGGNVGIGTTTPVAYLDVNQASPSTKSGALIEASSAATNLTNDFATLQLLNTNTTDNNYSSIDFTQNTSDQVNVRLAGITTNHTSRTADFAILTASAGSASEKLRVTGAGNVGIGTSTPNYILTVGGNGTGAKNRIALWGDHLSSNATFAGLSFFNTDANPTTQKEVAGIDAGRHGDNYGGSLSFFTAAPTTGATTTRLFIDSSGSVGIGTTTPNAKFAIAGTGLLQSWNTTFTDSASRRNWGVATEQSVTGDWQLQVSTAAGGTPSSAVISALSSGNVGIGTTSPGSLLSLNGIANFTTATTTFYSSGGINLTGGCFAIAGNCMGAGAGQMMAQYSTSTVGTTTVNFNGAANTAPSFSNGVLTLPSNAGYVVVEVWGGGGGGSGGNGGGSGGTGGTTCFGTNATACNSPTLQASGGIGAVTGGAGGSGGTGTGGDVNLTGGSGGSLSATNATQNFMNGTNGGSAPLGGGGGVGANTNNAAVAGAAFGGGGGGGSNDGGNGSGTYNGGGGGGGGYSSKLITALTSSYTFTVGAGGAAGSNGSGHAPAAGGAGGVKITVYSSGGTVLSYGQSKAPTNTTLASGSGTYTVPAGVSYIRVKMVGGGGAGGGVGQTTGTTGGSGGTTSFGSITAVGGSGGTGGNSTSNGSGGAGGTGGSGTVTTRLTGANGQGASAPGVSAGWGGSGGSSPFGGAANSVAAQSTPATNGANAVANTGSGGGGAISPGWAQPAGGGGAGEYVDTLIVSPSATYSYSIGAGGTGSSGTGSNPAAGGSGGSGVIIIDEYYGASSNINNTGIINSGTAGQFGFFQSNGTTLTGTSTLFLTTGGNIGVGTTTANANFVINGTSGQNLFQIASSTSQNIFIVDQNGVIGVGTTTTNQLAQMSLGYNSVNRWGIQLDDMTSVANPTGAIYASFKIRGTQIGSITNNNSTGVLYNTTSDRRLKENIATTSAGLDTLMNIEVSDFSFINDPSHATTTGFIAQNLKKYFPAAVTTNGDDGEGPLSATSTPWSVDYGRITPLIVKSVQDLNFKLDARTGGQATTTVSDLTASSTPNVVQNMSSTLVTAIATVGNMVARVFDGAISATVGIFNTVYAKEVHADKLCATTSTGNEVCVDGDQLESMLAGVATSTPQGGGTGGNTGGDTGTSMPATSTPPVITLIGADPAELNVGDTYSDLGVTIQSTVSPNIGYTMSLDGATSTTPAEFTLDTSSPGTHVILYSATDQNNQTGTATRTVIITDPNAGGGN